MCNVKNSGAPNKAYEFWHQTQMQEKEFAACIASGDQQREQHVVYCAKIYFRKFVNLYTYKSKNLGVCLCLYACMHQCIYVYMYVCPSNIFNRE
jgi:hypothetical protein